MTFFPEVRAVVFDAVGTLIDPDPPAALVYARVGQAFGSRRDAAAIAVRFAEAFRCEDDLDRASGLRTSEAREFERWRCIVTYVLDDVSNPGACFQVLFEHFGRPDAWRCHPAATTVLRCLAAKGLTLAMASNYDSRLRSVVAGISALACLRPLVISSEVGWRKPAPEFFAVLCQSVGCAPQETVYVGDDRGNDYDGARAAGLRAILYDPRGRALDVAECVGRLEVVAGLVGSGRHEP
jgi:putative hydrolase of the HAD superfamily